MRLFSIAEAIVLCCAFISVSCSAPEQGQPSDKEGIIISGNLHSKSINCFAEDRFGHIWIGTKRGLVKYTVDNFKYYTSTDKQSKMFLDNMVNALFRSSDGTLFIGTTAGACIYNEDDTFTPINIGPFKAVNGFIETPSGKILIDNFGMLYEYDKSTGTAKQAFRQYPHHAANHYCSYKEKLYGISFSSIVSYDLETYEMIDSVSAPFAIYHTAITEDGDMWMSGVGHLGIYDTGNSRFKPLPETVSSDKTLMSADVDYIIVLKDGSILLNTIGKGVYRYFPDEDRLLHESSPDFPFEVPSFRISTIFQDSNGNVWFGSPDQGFSVASTRRGKFNNDKFLVSAFAGKSVKSLCPDKNGNLWIATLNDGVYVYRSQGHELHRIDLAKFSDTSFGYLQCSEVFCDSKGDIWLILGEKGYILKGSYENGDFLLKKKYMMYGTAGLAEDEDGGMWLGSYSSNLFRLDEDSDIWHPVSMGIDGWTFVNSPIPLGNGRMLVSPFGHTPMEIDIRTEEIDTSIVTREHLDILTNGRLFIENVQMKDSRSDIWFGTVGCGLMRYDHVAGTVEAVSGTSSMDITAIIEDDSSDLWISTGRGISHWHRETGRFTNYFFDDGIGGEEFCDRSACKLEDGTILFGGSHGITVINPDDIGEKLPVPLVFEELYIFNDFVVPGKGVDSPVGSDLSLNPEIRLKHDQNSFRISFAALDYSGKSKTRYLYKMEGYDKYWIESGSVPSAFYANLPAGKYSFKVRVSGDNKDLSDVENSIRVRVLHAPWDTPLAWLGYILIVGAIVTTIVMQRRRAGEIKKEAQRTIMEEQLLKEQAVREKEREERLNKMQMSFFSNVSHEFRTPLTMISGPVSMLEKSSSLSAEDRNIVSVIKTSSEWMLRLVNQLLDFNKLENDTLRLQVAKADAAKVISTAASIFAPNAKTKNIAYTVFGTDVPALVYLDSDKVTKIVINLLSNAMKYTSPNGEVRLDFDVVQRETAARTGRLQEWDNDSLWVKIMVSDTGKGIPDNMKEKIFERYYQLDSLDSGSYNWGTGIGLYYARALAHLHHGYLFVTDKEDGTSGAVFTLMLPASSTSYAAKEIAPGPVSQAAAFPITPMIAGMNMADEEEDPDKPLILVVDDDIDVANYQKLLLSPYYRIQIRFNAESAMEYLTGQNEEPDLILCDVMMPGKDGYVFTRELRSNMQLSHIPVVLVTAKAAKEDKIEGLRSGADAYITKPFDPDYLLTLLKTTMERIAERRRSLGKAAGPERIEEEKLSPQDTAFMNELYALMDAELSNPELDIVGMSAKMKISRTKFYYKIKGLTGEPPSVFFKKYKLNIAAQRLMEGKYNMSEIADMTGFSSLSHFSTSFKHQFGVPPSSYRGEKAK